MTSSARRLTALGVAGATALAGVALVPPTATAHPDPGYYTEKVPTSRGYGGAVATVDPEATRAGLGVLKRGGNAVDAAVAAAAALGVTEPYSAGLGGGGYFVYYNARTGRVHTLDGRETAPASMPTDAFTDPATGEPYEFTPDLVTSGVSVGVPGTPATWQAALRKWGTYSLKRALTPAERLARRGFVVDETFSQSTEDNAERFNAYTTTPRLFLPGGEAPEVGSVFRNPGLARTYRMLGKKGMRAFLTTRDLADYRVISRRPTRVGYRGYGVYGMPPSSSGGSTVGEALNIMERFRLRKMRSARALHHYLEASALAFADRGAYVGDPAYVDVPLRRLLSDRFARERACQISETEALVKPVAPGDVEDFDGRCDDAEAGATVSDTENVETTNLTVSDKWGNVVEYTLTIEQTGGSGMLVPGRGFILNNELTDFNYGTEYDPTDPNRIQPGKRPRSSMSPTIVLRHGKPFMALGSPGGSTIITTVLQLLFNRIDRGMPLPRAMAAPRASQRNTATVSAEPDFIARYGPALEGLGHELTIAGDGLTSNTELGAATAIEFGRHGRLISSAEPRRRGGGSALVVHPSR
jgi:gamma-glutamyltranspeptidase/glutathione hydrolase